MVSVTTFRARTMMVTVRWLVEVGPAGTESRKCGYVASMACECVDLLVRRPDGEGKKAQNGLRRLFDAEQTARLDWLWR